MLIRFVKFLDRVRPLRYFLTTEITLMVYLLMIFSGKKIDTDILGIVMNSCLFISSLRLK